MNERAALDVNELIDGQRIGAPSIMIGALALLVMIADGFDVAVMGYVAPELLKEWRLPPTSMVPAFSAGIIGLMVGGPLIGLIGDKYGRRPVLICCLVLMGIFTLSTMGARNVFELAVLRFLTGVPLGGAIPIAAALIAELSPKRYRGRMLVAVLVGPAIGISIPGIATALLVPTFGWKALLVVGGVAPLLIAVASYFLLPESLRFLLSRTDKMPELRRIARRLRPELTINDDVAIVASAKDVGAHPKLPLALLFSGRFRTVTPLLWLAQMTIQTASFFALTWLPTLLQSSGASVSEAGVNASLFSIGGLLSAVLLIMTVDRWGAAALAACLLVGAPLVAYMTEGVSPFLHAAIIASAGFCVIGGQLCITVLLSLFYPTVIRSSGVGTTQAIGRLGALLAPVGGGALIGMGVSLNHLTLAPAILLLCGGISAAILAFLSVRIFGSVRPQEFTLRSHG